MKKITNDTELRNFLQRGLGVRIPDKRVCATHSSPWEAFRSAFWARDPVVTWWAARGFGGKSLMLASLAVSVAVGLGASVSVLGGSFQQSLHVRRYITRFIERPELRGMVAENTQTDTYFTNGAQITALAASQTAVRGPHPVRLLLDEVDEMSLDIFDAALGQPMARGDVPAGVVLSSTWQYPDATFSEVLRRAAERSWPVFSWCYQETLKPHGWLTSQDVERKRQTVSKGMWTVEYDLGQPSAENRAIQPECVEAMFQRELGEYEGRSGEVIEVEPPEPGASYVHGVDLARKRDYTVHVIFRKDVHPYRLVGYMKLQRMPWSVMMDKVNERRARYPGQLIYDQTGVGDVAGEFLDGSATGMVMVGRARNDLLSAFITGIEKGEMVAPLIHSMKAELLYASVDDVYTGGEGHLPDSFSAGALAYTRLRLGASAEDWLREYAQPVETGERDPRALPPRGTWMDAGFGKWRV